MCGFIVQLVEQRTGNAEDTGSNPVEALICFLFFQASSFQLLKLENLLRWSFFSFIYNHSSKMNYFHIPRIMDLPNHCLTSTYFQYNGKHYKQLHGTAMGSSVSVVVAEIVMQNIEEQALAT